MPTARLPRRALRAAAAKLASLALGAAALTLPAQANAGGEPRYFNPPQSRLPFSAAVQVGDVVYLSGAIGMGRDGSLPEFPQQVRNAMDALGRELALAGRGYDDVFKCIVALDDIKKFDEFSRVYTGYFKPGRLPVLTAFGSTGLVYGSALEIECMAHAAKKGGR